MKEKTKFELPQYGGVGIFTFILMIIGIISFSIWPFLGALLVAGIFLVVIYVAEEDSCEVDVSMTPLMRCLISGMLFFVLWPICQISGIFWCFLLGMIITIFFYMFRIPLCIFLFDYEKGYKSYINRKSQEEYEEKGKSKFQIFLKYLTDEDYIDLFFPYNFWYIGIFLVYMLIGWIALPSSESKEESGIKTEQTSTSDSKEDGPKTYKATTIKVRTQVEDNNTVYYIIIPNDTLRCKTGEGAIWLNENGGDRIQYTFKERGRQKQVETLSITLSADGETSNSSD